MSVSKEDIVLNLNDIEIMPTQQANAYYTHRK